ncbi:MAG: iron ABC transporter permease [Actinomycetota bacterium]
MGRDRAPLIATARSGSLGGRASRGLAAAVPVLFLGALVVWPLVAVFDRSFEDVGLGAVGDVLGRSSVRSVLWFTVWQAALSAGLTVLIGLPIAQVLARYQFRGRSALRALVIVPFVLPTVVVAAAVGAAFDRLGLGFDRSLGAVLAAHVFFNLAVVVRVVGGFWSGLDRRQVEAAMILGDSPARAWRSVTLRQLSPVLSGAFLLTFLFSFTSFGVIRVLGGLRRATIETEIHRYAIARQQFDVAAVLAALQIVVVLVLAVATARFQRRHASARRRTSPPLPVVGAARRLHLASVVGLVLLVIGGPVVVLVEQSLRVGDRYGLDNYWALGERVDLLPLSAVAALGNSLVFAAGAALVASVVGLAAAVTITGGGRVGRLLEAVALLPLGVSAVTLGFGYLVGLTVFDLRRSVLLVPLAHAVIGLPFVLAAVVPALRSVDPRAREAAATLGASPAAVRRTIDWPLTRRALATGAGFAAAVSIGEFGATSFLGRGEASFTAPLAIFRLLSNPGETLRGQALALSVVVGVVVALVAAAMEWRRQPGVTVL